MKSHGWRSLTSIVIPGVGEGPGRMEGAWILPPPAQVPRLTLGMTRSIARDQIADDPAGDAAQSLRFIAARDARRGAGMGQPAEGERLQDDVARAGERRVEQPFAAEERVAESADELDVVRHRLGHRHDA